MWTSTLGLYQLNAIRADASARPSSTRTDRSGGVYPHHTVASRASAYVGTVACGPPCRARRSPARAGAPRSARPRTLRSLSDFMTRRKPAMHVRGHYTMCGKHYSPAPCPCLGPKQTQPHMHICIYGAAQNRSVISSVAVSSLELGVISSLLVLAHDGSSP